MGKHDAVDRLMALATENRADRTPAAAPESGLAAPPTVSPLMTAAAAEPPARGRQLIGAVRPFLPVVAGALRMIDHGAVQAVARLLPLLGAGAVGPGLSPPAEAARELDQRSLASLQALAQAHRKDLDALQLQAATLEDELRRTRSLVERAASEQAERAQELRSIADRSRLLTAAVIILFMLVIAQMILLLVLYHK